MRVTDVSRSVEGVVYSYSMPSIGVPGEDDILQVDLRCDELFDFWCLVPTQEVLLACCG